MKKTRVSGFENSPKNPGFRVRVKLGQQPYSERIDLNARNVFGTTAFMQAWYNGHKDVVKLILKYSEVVNINIPESFK